MKTILMYSLLFSGVSAITKGVSEGMQNVAMYSDEANQALTEYKSTSLEVKNALGAALIPVLQTLYPLLRIGADALIALANGFNVLFSALQGKDSFVKAKAYTDDYAKSLNKLKSLSGMDEIHTIGDTSNYSEMFETVDLNADSFISAVSKFTAVVSILTFVQKMLTGKTWLSGLKNLTKLGSGLKSVGSHLLGMDPKLTSVSKKIIGSAGLVYGFSAAAKGAYDFNKALSSESKDGLGSSLLSLVTGGAAAIAGGAMIGGPIGAAIGGCVALVGALGGVLKAQYDLKLEMRRTEYYDVQGKKISEVKDALNGYFASLDFDKQSEWIQKIEEAQAAYDDALISYDLMWGSISRKTEFDTSDIENLTDVFENLADAAQALNDANIGSLMASIRTGIEMNITEELSSTLGALLDKIEEAKIQLSNKFSSLSGQYRDILTEIANNGGVATAEQKEKMSALRSDLSRFALSDDTSTARWNIEIDEALSNVINAGTDKDSIIANIQDLVQDRDTYLDNLKAKYAADSNTLAQLIELDRTEFGGQLGFTSDDLATLKSSYESQMATVRQKYNEVLEQIIATYSERALDWDKYHEDNGFLDVLDYIGAAVGGLLPWATDSNGDTGWEHIANKVLSAEQKEFIEVMRGFLLPGYATGGFPEDGLFMANSGELVGQFSNGKTAVANNEQIVEGISRGVSEATAEQNELLKEQNALLAKLLSKDNQAVVSVSTIMRGMERQNRRSGKTLIPIGR